MLVGGQWVKSHVREAYTYRFRAQVMKIINRAKANPRPMMMPYPNPCERGAVNVTVSEDMLAMYKQRFAVAVWELRETMDEAWGRGQNI